MSYLKTYDYLKYVDLVNTMVQQNIIAPVESSGLNGRRPALYKKYRVLPEKEDYSDIINEIKALSSHLDISYYLSNAKVYKQHRQYIKQLSSFLNNHYRELDTPASINERSYQIFGEEKFLKENPLSTAILKNTGIDIEVLNIYNTPEPFFYFNMGDYTSSIIILENKDTWYTLKKVLKEGKNEFHSYKFETLVYGEGWKIVESFSYLYEEEMKTYRDIQDIFYFGDLDYEGISIYSKLKAKYPIVKLFYPFYKDMLKLCDVARLKSMKQNQIKKYSEFDFGDFLNYFTEQEQEKIKEILVEGKYIPQEILNYKHFSSI